MKRPQSSEFPPYYQYYIDLVKNTNIIKDLNDQVMDIQAIISEIPEDKENYAYADGKWTIKEVLGHIIDSERVFGYRAMRFARKDKTALAGYDEKLFVANAKFKDQTLYSLAHEFAIVREANLSLFKTFDDEAFDQTGNANGTDVSVRAILYMIVGHAAHHMHIIKTRYLLD
jgi:uncharacterized damage-inducible protein DinB